MTTFKELVASKGSVRRVAQELSMHPTTLARYISGARSVPPGLPTKVRKMKPVGNGRPGRKLQVAL